MTIVTFTGIVLLVVLVACVAVLSRRGRGTGPAKSGGRSPAELDATARSGSARASDRQGLGPF